MKFPAKTLIALCVSASLAGAALATEHAGPSAPGYPAPGAGMPDYMKYRSTVTTMPIDRSFNDIDVTRQSETNTTTDASTKTKDSYNKSLDLNAEFDSSQRTAGSYNKSKETNTDIDVDSQYDASQKTVGSYNKRKETNTHTDVSVDASKHASSSFNRDHSNRDWSTHGSYNTTDKSVNDSYNQRYDTRQKWLTDTNTVRPEMHGDNRVRTGDTQNGSNTGYQNGGVQSGSNGDFSLGNFGNDGQSMGGGYGRHYGEMPGYGAPAGPLVENSNTQVIDNRGPAIGSALINNNWQSGRDNVMGPKGSIVGSDLGNKQSFYQGDQNQLQKNDQFKSGDQSAVAGNAMNTEANKTSSGL